MPPSRVPARRLPAHAHARRGLLGQNCHRLARGHRRGHGLLARSAQPGHRTPRPQAGQRSPRRGRHGKDCGHGHGAHRHQAQGGARSGGGAREVAAPPRAARQARRGRRVHLHHRADGHSTLHGAGKLGGRDVQQQGGRILLWHPRLRDARGAPGVPGARAHCGPAHGGGGHARPAPRDPQGLAAQPDQPHHRVLGSGPGGATRVLGGGRGAQVAASRGGGALKAERPAGTSAASAGSEARSQAVLHVHRQLSSRAVLVCPSVVDEHHYDHRAVTYNLNRILF
mmetsp:Transcript_25939/g.76020  ORF Transcript_25939/g.76020 Transcript_25939/m.76020 type:complete len:283 (-) Transcript_25939:70-918(-)